MSERMRLAHNGQVDLAGVTPLRLPVNYVRLTLYARCRWSPDPPSSCAGVV